MPHRSIPRTVAGTAPAIFTENGWREFNLPPAIPPIITPGFYNPVAAAARAERHERLFYDKWGRHLLRCAPGTWGQKPQESLS